MVGKQMNAEGTVTYGVLQPSKDEGAAPPAENENEKENEEVPAEGGQKDGKTAEKQEADKRLPHKFVPDVMKEPKLKFFQVPRLGSYLAISLKYNSCLYESSLDKAFENHFAIAQEKEAQEKVKQEHEEKVQKEREEKEAAGEVYKEEPFELKNIEEPPYPTQEREYVLCLDTIGQDRAFSEAERNFALDIAKHVVVSWEEIERNALTKDKMLRVGIKARDEDFKDKEFAEITQEIEKAAEEAAADEAL
jgi:hypothetical protein